MVFGWPAGQPRSLTIRSNWAVPANGGDDINFFLQVIYESGKSIYGSGI